jgi:hypothetical protein
MTVRSVKPETAADIIERAKHPRLTLRPITLRQAQEFVQRHHRHNKPPRGWLFGTSVSFAGAMVGVAVAGRPIARELQDGLTIEVTRTCTDGSRNANSKLYGAIWRAAVALGYTHGVTYTQDGEDGASLKAAGWTRTEHLPARAGWADSSVKDRSLRDKPQASLIEDDRQNTGGIDRWRWEKFAC